MSGDDRVVGIEFDNASFERKLSQTISSLDKLQQTLEKQNGKKALEDLSTAGSKFDPSSITAGIEGISAKFLAMSTIGITALASIAGKAVDVGIQLAKSLSLDNIMSGFQEYETNMNSIQTIMTNTRKDGTTLQDVEGSLQKLNEYSDQTIYNFAQMARNIGTFTAAGIDLDTSTQAIKGIANLAAASGSNAEQASSAMYQLSQALAAGTLKAMDWNSVVNAGMGGEMFQEALFEAGKLKGTLETAKIGQSFEQWKAAGNSFKGSLEDGWITADVLTTTLQGFTGDLTEAQLMSMGYTQAQAQEVMAMGAAAKAAATEVKTFSQLTGTIKESIGSGWSQSFKIILGDFDEAKTLFTGINNAIGEIVSESADKRNALLQGWKDLGGRFMLIDAIKQAAEGVWSIIERLRMAFEKVFPPMTAQSLADLTWKFRDFIEKLTPGVTALNRIQRIFEGVFSAIQIGIEVIKGIFGVFKTLFQELTDAAGGGGGILKFFAGIATSVVELNDKLVEGGGIAAFFEKITEAIKNPLPYLEKFLDYLTSLGDGAGGDVINAIVKAFQDALPVLEKVRDFFGQLKDKIADFISSIDIGGGGGGLDIGSKFGDSPEVIDNLVSRFEHLKDIVSGVADFFQTVGGAIGGLWEKISPVLDEVYDHIRDWLSSLGDKLADAIGTGDFNKVLDVVNVGLLGGILVILRKFLKGGFKFDLGGGFFEKISGSFEQLTGVLKSMQTKIKADALIKIAIALGILTASLVVLSLIDSAALTKALTAMAVGFGQLAAMMKLMEKITSSPVQFVALATGLLLVAGAMLVLSLAMLIFSTMSWEDIAKGLTAVTVLLGTLVGVSKLLDASDMIKAGAGILVLAGGMVILGLALRIFAGMSLPDMAQGLIGVGIGLVVIAEAMKRMPNISPKDGAALILIAAGLLVLGFAVEKFAALSWEEMAKGFISVGAGLLIIAGAMHLMPKDMLATAAGLLLISVALLLIAKAIGEFAGMSMGEVGKGLGIMAASLILLAVAAHAMSGAVAGAIAIGIMAVSLVLLVGVLEQLAKLSLTELAIAIGALAAVFVVLGLAALILQPVIPALMLLGVALALIGLGFVLFGAGVALAAAGFAALAKAGDAGIKVFVALLDALIAKIPEFLAAIASGMLDALQIFVDMLPQLMEMLVTVVTSLLNTIKTLIPEVVAVVVVIIQTLIGALVTLYPDIIAAGFALLMALLNGIKDNIGEIVTSVLGIITAFLDAITASLPEITASALNLLVTFLLGITDQIQTVTDTAVTIIITLVKGVADNLFRIIAAATSIITEFLGEIGKSTVKIIAAGTDIIIDMLTGIENAIRDNSQELSDAGWGVIDAIIDGMMLGFTDLTGKLYKKAESIATDLISKLSKPWEFFSPSHLTRRWGGYILQGLMIGLEDQEDKAYKTIGGISENMVITMADTLAQIPDILTGMEEFNPTITPVLDLTAVKQEAQNLAGMLDTSALNATVSIGQARIISAEANVQGTMGTAMSKGSEVKFEQTINAPKELSTADIYRQTRNLVALAKEELAIV